MTRLARELNQLLYERNKAEAEVAALQVMMCTFECTRAREREREPEGGRGRMRVSVRFVCFYIPCVLVHADKSQLKTSQSSIDQGSIGISNGLQSKGFKFRIAIVSVKGRVESNVAKTSENKTPLLSLPHP